MKTGGDRLDTRLRLRLLTDEHTGHRLTLNVYVGTVGAHDARVWCVPCGRTLRTPSATRPSGEVEIGLG